MHLSHHHALALVTLARHLIRADGVISEPELHAMMDMAKTIGLQTFSSALQRTDDMPALTSSQLDGLVDADVGRLHYDYIAFVGNPGPDIGASYGEARNRCELSPRGTAVFIGAGGPMGQMHVQRAAEDVNGPAVALCTDVDDGRLGTIPARYGEAASATGTELICVNPTTITPDEMASRAKAIAPNGFDDIVILAPIAALIDAAMDDMGENGVLNIFAGLARGTMPRRSMS